MKKFDRIIILYILVFAVMIIGLNMLDGKFADTSSGREYRVYLKRAEQEIKSFEQENMRAPQNLRELFGDASEKEYEGVLELSVLADAHDVANVQSFKEGLADENNDYCLVITDNYIYKLSYDTSIIKENRINIFANVIVIIIFAMTLFMLFYVRKNILVPFNEVSNLPYELAKGKLAKPVKENKNKYFGRFTWGIDMLREHLEQSRQKELELQKEKKLLLLSLSHDIKTPLNAIDLYAKALERNLYSDEEKRKLIAKNISSKAGEIEGYMSEIVKASKEDFLSFEVSNSEVYVKDVLTEIANYYEDKMLLNKIDFKISDYSNCLIHGDRERIIEVLQNIIENAVKYGDGREIEVSMKKDIEEYVISVRNTGCTLQHNELPHVFDSFFRGSNAGNKNGSGLGLYICRELMHLMDGEILAEIVDGQMEVKVIFQLA